MKKVIILFLLVFGLSALLFAGYSISHRGKKIASLESIVSEECLHYLSSSDLSRKINDLLSSPFVEQVCAASFYIKHIKPRLDDFIGRAPLLSDLVVRDAALALFSPKSAANINNNAGGNVLFLVSFDPKNKINFKKYISDFYLSLAAKDTVSYKKYKGMKITSYSLRGQPLSCVFFSDTMLVSDRIDILEKSIDLYKGQSGSSLSNNEVFRKVASRIKKDALIWGFANGKNLSRETLRLLKSAPQESKLDRTAMKPFTSLQGIFEASVFYYDYSELKDGLIAQSYTLLDRTKDEDRILDVILGPGKLDENIFKPIPEEAIGYYVGSLDMLGLFRLMKKWLLSLEELKKAQLAADPRYSQHKDKLGSHTLDSALKSIDNFLEADLENDILSLFDNSFGVVLTGVSDLNMPMSLRPQAQDYSSGSAQDMSIFFPRGHVFLELKDSQEAQDTLDQLIKRLITKINQQVKEQERQLREIMEKQAGMQGATASAEAGLPALEAKDLLTLNIDNYQGAAINTIDILNFPVPELRPSFCILDKYLILSLMPGQLKEAIDSYKGIKGSFASGFEFSFIQNRGPQGYSQLAFFDSNKLISSLKITRAFGNLRDLVTNNPKANFSKKDFDSVAEILSNISRVTFKTNILDQDTIESFSYLEIKGL